jgi:hypothetical protein
MYLEKRAIIQSMKGISSFARRRWKRAIPGSSLLAGALIFVYLLYHL